ncbi:MULTISPECIES: anti-sigma factor family protein [Mycobacteriaceae]|uniref:Zf-HC2 domain-containing protein n=10 Tax=Mycobacteriaceae TaxID=1762 RepID=A0A4R5P4C0_9MYCO|nr:hypothetical protein CAK77_03755 [Mycobacteroides abscessus subsp. massiliense]AXO22471.1 zf-HC2 domain-containing protein [Mycobacterium avium subsp. hominissuis]EUA03885.1 zinc-finger family protein [Mycobacterium kansasii 824]KAA1426357.1 zf-HC2 domain-containing protein [Mycolicibacter arupensis]OOK77229.1 zinc-finger family protein [Mycobacterium kansasii]OTQ97151.1 hypothetical protein B9M86_03580 [Mycobacteroides abscessus]PBA00618.1 anti-sigma factor [Mycobacterium avium]TDH17797.
MHYMKGCRQMRCNELAELLTEYLDDSLGSSDHVRLETHLSECAGCANYRTQYISTIAILNQIPVAGFKRTLRDTLSAHLHQRRR